MTQQAVNNREQLYGIRQQLLSGQITYEQAKAQAQPIIDSINLQMVAIAKKHGKRPAKISFAAIMR